MKASQVWACLGATGAILVSHPARAQNQVDWQSSEFLKCDANASGLQLNVDECYRNEAGRLASLLSSRLAEIKKKATQNQWASIQKAQRAWTVFQSAQCRAVYEVLGGNRSDAGTVANSDELICQAQTFAERVDQLDDIGRQVGK